MTGYGVITTLMPSQYVQAGWERSVTQNQCILLAVGER